MAARITGDWQWSKVGPFALMARFRGLVDPELPGQVIGQGSGRVFSAFNRYDGRRAVLVEPNKHPASAWSVRVQASPGPVPFVALEVERAPTGEAPISELAEGLGTVASALQDLENRPDAVEHVTMRPVRRLAGRPRQRQALGLLLAASGLAACTVGAVTWWPAGERALPTLEPAPQLLAGVADSAADAHVPNPLTIPGEYVKRPLLAGNDLPRTARKGQAKADKNGKCETKFEVAIYGLCWVRLHGNAPCGPTAYEYEGGCYRPSMEEPTSRAPRTGPGPLTSAE